MVSHEWQLDGKWKRKLNHCFVSFISILAASCSNGREQYSKYLLSSSLHSTRSHCPTSPGTLAVEINFFFYRRVHSLRGSWVSWWNINYITLERGAGGVALFWQTHRIQNLEKMANAKNDLWFLKRHVNSKEREEPLNWMGNKVSGHKRKPTLAPPHTKYRNPVKPGRNLPLSFSCRLMGLISSSWAGDHSCSQHSWLAGTDCDPHTAAGVCGSQIIPNQIIPNMRNWRSEKQTIKLYNLNLSVSIKYNWSNITKCFSKYID